MKSLTERLGKAIILCRNQKDISQKDLAEITGLSMSYVSLLERGKRNLNILTLQKISSALEMPIYLLMFLADSSEIFNSELTEKLSAQVLIHLRKEKKES